MKQLFIGNAISLVAAVLLAASCCVNQPRRIYLLQICTNLVLCLSSIVLGAWSGVVTLLLSSLRFYLIIRKKFNFPLMILFSAAVLLLGILANNRGLIGLLPVIAGVQFTVCTYFAKKTKSIKLSILINISLWAVYSFLILDIVSGVSETVNALVCLISLLKPNRDTVAAADKSIS